MYIYIYMYIFCCIYVYIFMYDIWDLLASFCILDDFWWGYSSHGPCWGVPDPRVWVNFITTEPCSPEAWNHGFYMGNHPQMAARFRLVKYDNLLRRVILVRPHHICAEFFNVHPFFWARNVPKIEFAVHGFPLPPDFLGAILKFWPYPNFLAGRTTQRWLFERKQPIWCVDFIQFLNL